MEIERKFKKLPFIGKKPVIINPELNRINQVNYNLNRRKRA